MALSNVCKQLVNRNMKPLTMYEVMNLYHQQCLLRTLESIEKLLKDKK